MSFAFELYSPLLTERKNGEVGLARGLWFLMPLDVSASASNKVARKMGTCPNENKEIPNH